MFVSAFALAPLAGAQPVRACPPGQAVQALDPGGKVSGCIPVPSANDLNGRVDAEAVARMQGDQAVRDAIDEKSLAGTYAFFGTRSCVSNTAGFDPSGAPLAPQAPFNQWAMSRGSYTFNADGTGSASADVLTIDEGNATRTLLTSAVQWSIENGKLIVQGDFRNDTIHTENPAPQTGMLGKDLTVIGIGQEGIHVETVVQTRLIGGVPTEVRTPRICNRQATLTKMAD